MIISEKWIFIIGFLQKEYYYYQEKIFLQTIYILKRKKAQFLHMQFDLWFIRKIYLGKNHTKSNYNEMLKVIAFGKRNFIALPFVT